MREVEIYYMNRNSSNIYMNNFYILTMFLLEYFLILTVVNINNISIISSMMDNVKNIPPITMYDSSTYIKNNIKDKHNRTIDMTNKDINNAMNLLLLTCNSGT